ncbi:MAG: hypothetical protein ACYDAG_16220, partial [Chloroflexota bacterium]
SLQVEQSPFTGPSRFVGCWVRPEVVVTASFEAWDPVLGLRQATFERIRLDVRPEECLLADTLEPAERPEGQPGEQPRRPVLTMLATLPLPLPDEVVPRPFLRVVRHQP